MSWTDERVETLKKLWMEGLSASQIAGELGEGVTRNAVIGKVHRLKLSARAKTVSAAPRLRPQQGQTTPIRRLGASPTPSMQPGALAGIIKRTVMRTQSVGATALAAEPMIDMEPEAVQATEEVVVPKSERISLLRLTESTCKWPIGDPLSADFHFCGGDAEGGKPYCEFHSRRAYHQVEKRKR